ncbi:MAG: hypothetical protein OXF20_09150 [Gammaproteobacteria bacterium]|nr:hypothetical protein [Gammaproteobacteria bacterium]
MSKPAENCHAQELLPAGLWRRCQIKVPLSRGLSIREIATISSLVGSTTKLYDDDELWERYDHYYNDVTVISTCSGAANDARDNAFKAMIRLGRSARDIEAGERRITDFYQTSLLRCQAHFKRLYDKYKGRFCN